jgi:iron complex transport system ATP-binding protein
MKTHHNLNGVTLPMQSDSTFQVHPEFVWMRNVNVARGENVVLHDLDLKIGTGEHVAILGPNGCGKSTLIKTVTCECYPIVRPGMEIRIYGRNRWDVQELRKHLGVVMAELPGERTPRTSGLDAVVSGFFSSSTLWPNLQITEAMHESALEALDLLEARYLSDRLVGHMSAGETRRVMIARALVHKPETLLLDEPSNALDFASQRELREILRGLARNSGHRKTGIVMVTHHLADILPEIDRVIMMRGGRIVGDGPKAALLSAKKLSELFGVDLELTERNGYWHSW